MAELKNFFPTICPACGNKLVIELGDKSDSYKLMCKNPDCSGSNLKKLQKGIIALDIKGLGPKVIESLVDAGINSSLDLFDPQKFNEKVLISSGQFRKGRALEKIINSVSLTKNLPIDKAILSLQLPDVGKTVSEKIGLLISGLPADFTGLPYSIRDNIDEIKNNIIESLNKFESFGIKIIKHQPKQEVKAKTVTKNVTIENNSEIKDFVEKLKWNIVPIENCDFFICIDDKSDSTNEAIKNDKKIMTLKKVKLIFG
jgi:NAD-dependent DNA ligase